MTVSIDAVQLVANAFGSAFVVYMLLTLYRVMVRR